jgi:imidazolonepropionase
MLLIHNIATLFSLDESLGSLLGEISDASILIDGGSIWWCGKAEQMPAVCVTRKIDAGASIVLPGFIDCHSHLIFAGSRADEFSRRMNNESYEEIVQKGGGIMNTVIATREASDNELYSQAYKRASDALLRGTTTLEVKSGYGLTIKDELRILRVVAKLQENHPLDFHATFLGAHTIPKEYKERPSAYVDMVIEPLLRAIKAENLAIDCDVFCERGAFSLLAAQQILARAHELGFGLRAHVQQLSYESGGVSLLKDLPIKSISHADFLSNEDISLIKEKGCVVEALPFASLFVRTTNHTPVQKLLNASIPLAIATDFNPGTAMCFDMLLAARLSVVYLGFTLETALKAMTKIPAIALGRDDIGVIKKGNKADIIITSSPSLSEFMYDWTVNPVAEIIKNGEQIMRP